MDEGWTKLGDISATVLSEWTYKNPGKTLDPDTARELIRLSAERKALKT